MIHNSIQNLIFDLGGVIMDLHVDKSHNAFAQLSNRSIEEIQAKIAQSTCFVAHEKGLISDAQFRDEVRTLLGMNLTDAEIDNAWNAMLGDIPLDRLQLLKRLRNDYKVFLLSNTNSIHLPIFSETVKVNSGEEASLESYFDKAYYSHVMKMRKPDEEIFKKVLIENQLIAENTLFLDDFLPNLKGAEKAGLKTFHVQGAQSIFSLFS